MDPSSTMVAVASPPGRSLRGIVRVDGPGTFDLLDTVLAAPCPRARGITTTRLRLGSWQLPAMLLTFPSPHSYTGGEAVELQLPGNPALLERVVTALLDGGARPAEAGEFTARGFLSGRMSLTQAEGVAATIAARSDAELAAARLLTRGALGDFARDLADEVAAALALVEAGIDFTDQEDVVAIAPDDLRARIATWTARLSDLLDRAVGMEQLAAIPWVVLSGAPNAGKSTLFNALLGHDRAVVSRVAGTTRDVLAEPLAIDTAAGSAEIMLVDVAGAEHGDEPLDVHMQEAAEAARARAELILHCVPADEWAPGPPGLVLPKARPRDGRTSREVLVITKTDLGEPVDVPADAVAVSAAATRGLHRVRRAIADRLADRAVSLAADAMALRPRHETALRAAAAALEEAGRAGVIDRAELAAASLRHTLDELGRIAGEVTPDDVLGRIFASFCVGK